MQEPPNETEIKSDLSEADELLNDLNAGIIEDMEETNQIQLKIYADRLKKLKIEAQGKNGKGDTKGDNTASEGIHEAIDDIVKAMKTLSKNLT